MGLCVKGSNGKSKQTSGQHSASYVGEAQIDLTGSSNTLSRPGCSLAPLLPVLWWVYGTGPQKGFPATRVAGLPEIAVPLDIWSPFFLVVRTPIFNLDITCWREDDLNTTVRCIWGPLCSCDLALLHRQVNLQDPSNDGSLATCTFTAAWLISQVARSAFRSLGLKGPVCLLVLPQNHQTSVTDSKQDRPIPQSQVFMRPLPTQARTDVRSKAPR